MGKRHVEVFIAGCPVCEPTVQLVQEMACSNCEVTVHDLRKEGADKAKQYGIATVPAVVIDGELLTCCRQSGPDREVLVSAGLGQP